MEFLLDNNLPPSLAPALEAEGFVAKHVRSLGHRDSADVTIMRLAQERGAVVVTQDNDFPQLLAMSRASQPSVVLLRKGAPVEPKEIAALVRAFDASIVRALEEGAVVSIDERGERVRRLPLR